MKMQLVLPFCSIVFLSSCGVQQAMDRNKIAIQRSTCAIERNVDALNKVTANLEKMQESES